ncbi:MAG TPA: amidohydrolase family protein [Thermoanaerobaculia bacterium]|nr:amidohydrolase family protein [Thermoanaerobaculia bacterium]
MDTHSGETARRRWRGAALCAALLLPLGIACAATRDAANRTGEASDAVAFIGVHVVPMTEEGAVLPDRTVLVRNGRIAAIGPKGEVEIPAGALTIDGAGRYLLPGLADLHVHLEYFENPDILALFLANGVTTVRNMDGRPGILEWRNRIAAGDLLGPTIVTAGPILDGDPPLLDDNTVVRTAAEAASAVAGQADAGYDFVKVYTNLSAEAYEAVLAAAKERGLPVAGHIPRTMDLERVLASGQTSLEHLDGYDDAIEADDSPVRNRWHWSKLYMAMPADPEKIRQAAQRTAASGVWNVPTLVVKDKVAPLDEMVRWLDLPEMRYLPQARAAWDPRTWDPQRARLINNFDAEDRETLVRGRGNRLALVRALHQAGAGLLVGTDTPNPFVFPGFAIHEELRAFVDAGLTSAEALAAATREPARFLGTSDFGTVEPGKRADLLLLEANPLEDVGNLARRTGVMVRGRWLPEAELQGMLERLATP